MQPSSINDIGLVQTNSSVLGSVQVNPIRTYDIICIDICSPIQQHATCGQKERNCDRNIQSEREREKEDNYSRLRWRMRRRFEGMKTRLSYVGACRRRRCCSPFVFLILLLSFYFVRSFTASLRFDFFLIYTGRIGE